MRLTDEELRAVLARAEEIERGNRRGQAVTAEFNAVVEAGVAVGLARSAIEQALRERGDLVTRPVPGERAFARSADGNYYPADVLSADDKGARVRFLRGAEHTVALDELRPFHLIPGERVTVNWPWWGPWTCTVMAYDAEHQQVKVSDGWGEQEVFNVAEIWWAPPRRKGRVRTRLYAILLGSGWVAGAAMAMGLAWWWMRG